MITIFDWLDFKEVGDCLSINTKESHIRGAITMYYYAVFSAIRDYLINIKHQFQFKNSWKVHKRVWEFLLNSSDDNVKSLFDVIMFTSFAIDFAVSLLSPVIIIIFIFAFLILFKPS